MNKETMMIQSKKIETNIGLLDMEIQQHEKKSVGS